MMLSVFPTVLMTTMLLGAASQSQEQVLPQKPQDPELAAPTPQVSYAPNSRVTVGTLAKIQNYFRTTKSLRARFKQRSADGAIVRGNLAMQRPGKARFDYDGENSLLMVSDGEVVSLIDYEVQEVTRWPVSDTPLRLLLSDELSLKGYRAQIEDEQGSDRNFVLHAEDPENRELGIISLRFADQGDEGLDLLGWRVVTPDSGVTYVDLSEFSENMQLDPKLWTFKDPRGAGVKRRRRR